MLGKKPSIIYLTNNSYYLPILDRKKHINLFCYLSPLAKVSLFVINYNCLNIFSDQ